MSKNYPTFRALMSDGDIMKIPLHNSTEPGQAFRIIKLITMPNDVDGSSSHECSVQVFSVKPSSAPVDIDFNDDTLMAAAYYARTLQSGASPYVILAATEEVIFDSTIVNQDIYVTYKSGQTGQKLNVYLELEEMDISKGEQAVVNFRAALLHGE